MEGKAREKGDILEGWFAVLCLGRGDRSVSLSTGVTSPGVWASSEQPCCAEFAVGNAELIISQTALTIWKKSP